MKFAQEISIFNPFAIEKKVLELGTSITQTAHEIELRASEIYATKGQMYDVESRISQTAHTISLTVRGTADKTTGAGITVSLLDDEGNVISEGAGTIKLNGNVVFANDLSGSGTTTVNGSRIHGGTLKLGGASNGNGQMFVYDASNNEIGHWNNTGVYIKNGEIYQEQYVNSTVKNAWLRIKSTEVTGGYTGLGHTASVDLADYVDVSSTSGTRKIGVLRLSCANGGVAITPDDSFIVNTPKDISVYSKENVSIASTDYEHDNTHSALALTQNDVNLFYRANTIRRSNLALTLTTASLYTKDSSGTERGSVYLSNDVAELYVRDSGNTVRAAFSTNANGITIITSDDFRIRRSTDQGAYQASTAFGTGFAPTLDGQRRVCDIVNGIICNLRTI